MCDDKVHGSARGALAAAVCVAAVAAGVGASSAASTGAAVYPTTTIVLNGKGLPAYSPRRLRVRTSYGCTFTIHNSLPTGEWVLYGTPGSWKKLEYIAAGADGGAGIGIPMRAYFSLYDNQKAVLTVICR